MFLILHVVNTNTILYTDALAETLHWRLFDKVVKEKCFGQKVLEFNFINLEP